MKRNKIGQPIKQKEMKENEADRTETKDIRKITAKKANRSGYEKQDQTIKSIW
uniref:Uncharacterized protein n=1 Tax=Rhizophora mucronata TaxID=61149 RepID=A0A2P2IYR3_RHIMU